VEDKELRRSGFDPLAKAEGHRDVEKVLSEEILAEARRKAERAVTRAQLEGEKLVESAVKDAEALRHAVLEETRRRIERERQVFDSSLRLEERMRRLKTQGALIDEVFASAHLKLAAGKSKMETVVVNLAVEAVLAMKGSAFVVHLPPLGAADLESMKNTLPGAVAAAVRSASAGREVHLTVANTPAPIDHGVIVESEDGRERVDNSFATRLARMKGELRFDVAKLVFPEKEPTG